MGLDMHSRKEVVKGSYRDYQKATKKDKKEMPDNPVKVTGLNRDYLAHVLASYKETGEVVADGKLVKLKAKSKRKARAEGKRGGRPVNYRPGFVKVLRAIRMDHGRPCGKLLVPALRSMVDFPAASGEPDYGISEDIRALLLRVSAAEADILLKAARKALVTGGISTTRSKQTPLRAPVPVQTRFNRATTKPGDLAFDTVAHCGGSAGGQFCKSMTATSPYSGRVEQRPLLNPGISLGKSGYFGYRKKPSLPYDRVPLRQRHGVHQRAAAGMVP